MYGRCKNFTHPALLCKEGEKGKALFARSEERAVERSDDG
jgi:hypothetical protein